MFQHHRKSESVAEDSVMSDVVEPPTTAAPASPDRPDSAPAAGPSTLPGGDNSLSPLQPSGPICSFGQRLAYTYFSKPLPDAQRLNAIGDAYWFTIDHLLLYLSFYRDTGPLNCACLYRFCLHLHGLIEDASPSSPSHGKRIILYSSDEPDKKANASLLMALYCMIVLRWSPAEALHPLADLELKPFRDAGYARADFHLSAQNVLFGIRRAIDLRLLKLDEFDLKEYETFEKVENGDYNWLSPGFIAFASPNDPWYNASETPTMEKAMPARLPKAFRNILDRFEKVNVKLVIRLNKKLYDERHFTDRGIAHKEMYFDDGTNPPMAMVRDFIDICDKIVAEGGVIAVHCKAGLGRTGTLIGAYLIYKYGFTAEEAIGFMRIMRPGTCVGPQQHFLYENQMTWVRWAATDAVVTARSPRIERPITPPSEEEARPVPRTPTHGNEANGAIVPGQPRKTPGAKRRHMVAQPETRPIDDGPDAKDAVDTIQLELKTNQRPAPLPNGEQSGTGSSSSSIPTVGTVRAASVHAPAIRHPTARTGGAVTRGAAASANQNTQVQSTKIGRLRQRPLSALSDNQRMDRMTTGSLRDHGAVKRSKGSKDLGTLFEDFKSTGVPHDGSRYNLRGGNSRTTSGAFSNSNSGSPTTLPASSSTNVVVSVSTTDDSKLNEGTNDVQVVQLSASPTRLPQRVPSRRRGMVKDKSATGGACQTEAVTGHLNSRSVRRRRSSLGTADVLA